MHIFWTWSNSKWDWFTLVWTGVQGGRKLMMKSEFLWLESMALREKRDEKANATIPIASCREDSWCWAKLPVQETWKLWGTVSTPAGRGSYKFDSHHASRHCTGTSCFHRRASCSSSHITTVTGKEPALYLWCRHISPADKVQFPFCFQLEVSAYLTPKPLLRSSFLSWRHLNTSSSQTFPFIASLPCPSSPLSFSFKYQRSSRSTWLERQHVLMLLACLLPSHSGNFPLGFSCNTGKLFPFENKLTRIPSGQDRDGAGGIVKSF